MNIDNKQIRIIYALLPGAIKNDQEAKESLITQYTGDPDLGSVKDLGAQQADRLISDLRVLKQKSIDPADRMRKKILSICHDMGWELEDGRIDWKRLNGWLIKYGYLHKKLNDYKLQELPALVTQFENVQRSSYENH